jgi:hypothetical protein
MKALLLSISLILSYSALHAQLNNTSSSNLGSMTLGNGNGTLHQFAGAQQGSDGTGQSQGGFGILSGTNQISPIIWMYEYGDRNAFQIRKKKYNQTVQTGPTLFHVGVNGNIGVGTDNPSQKLSVNGNLGFNSEYNRIVFPEKLGYAGGITGDDGQYKRLTLYHGHSIALQTGSNDRNHANTRLYVNNAGNIGIGTTSPAEKLDVAGKIQTDYLRVNAVTASEGGEITLDGPAGYNDWRIDNYNGRFRLHHSGINQLIVLANGNVGIGTITTGNHKLAVEGTIGAREVKVETAVWPDYVFKDDYKLRSLEEVEQHIDQNGHLPEIPTEADVTENGILLGEMNAKLLQKIEELTLYMIDVNHQMKAHNEEIYHLKQENLALKKVLISKNIL